MIRTPFFYILCTVYHLLFSAEEHQGELRVQCYFRSICIFSNHISTAVLKTDHDLVQYFAACPAAGVAFLMNSRICSFDVTKSSERKYIM